MTMNIGSKKLILVLSKYFKISSNPQIVTSDRDAFLCASVCVCPNEKRVPDEWQARQAKIASAMKRKVQDRKRPISSVESLSS